MKLEKHLFGSDDHGEPIESYTLWRDDDLSITVLNYGATLQSVTMRDKEGDFRECTIGFNTAKGYVGDHPYFGATVGRFANRIAGGRFSVEGKEYTLSKNDGDNSLHGGKEGFNRKIWKAEPFDETEKAGIIFRYVSPDGEEGYPGTLSVEAGYTLTEQGDLWFQYKAATDKTTPINLTNHTYWNLEGDESDSIAKHRLTLHGKNILPVNESLIPTGVFLPVQGTPYDFLREKEIGKALKSLGGIDHCYVLGNETKEMQQAAALYSPVTGIMLELFTDQPGMQLYTGNFLEGVTGRGGKQLTKHCAVCLETQTFPDAVHHDDFPSPWLAPGEEYSHSTRIHLYVKE